MGKVGAGLISSSCLVLQDLRSGDRLAPIVLLKGSHTAEVSSGRLPLCHGDSKELPQGGQDGVLNPSTVDGNTVMGPVREQQGHDVITNKLKLALGFVGQTDVETVQGVESEDAGQGSGRSGKKVSMFAGSGDEAR